MTVRPASRWQAAGWWLAAAFPVLALVVDKAASTIFALFFLAGLWLLVTRRTRRPDPAVRWVLVAFAAYFLVGVLAFALGEHTRLGEKLLGRDIRFLGAVAVYFALARAALPERWLRAALVLGGVVTGLVAIVEVLLAAGSDYRAGGETISIVFGHLSVLLFAANVALVLLERRGRGLAILAALLALAAVALSGTRGALPGVIVVLVAGLVLAARRDPWWQRGRRIAIAGVLSLAVVVAGLAWLAPRLAEGWHEFQAYLAVPEVDAPRGCLDERGNLQRLLAFSQAYGLATRVVEVGSGPGCTGRHAIELTAPPDDAGTWVGPYRSLPPGAAGEIVVRGQGRLRFAGDGDIKVNARTPQRLELPQVADVERTRLRIRLSRGETLWLVPVESHPAEYAFAAANSSIGNRLMMWSAALRRVDAAPLGRGPGSWPLIAAEEAAAGRIAWRLAGYDHPHSDYFTVLLERGWLGLAALIAVFATPLAWAVRARGEPGWRHAGVALIAMAAAVSALTETVFNHSIGITYYCALVLLLLTARPQDAAAARPARPPLNSNDS